MADNLKVKDALAADRDMRADEVGGFLHQVIKLGIGAAGVANFLSGGAGNTDAGTVRVRSADDDPMSAGGVAPGVDLVRPSDTAVYTAGDSWANAISSATAYGIANASRGDGKGGMITDIFLSQKVAPATMLQGELWFLEAVPSNPLQDNAAWALSDADMDKVVGIESFTMLNSGSVNGNSYCHLKNLSIGFVTSGGATLYVIPKVTNAYTPTPGEVLRVRPKIMRWN